MLAGAASRAGPVGLASRRWQPTAGAALGYLVLSVGLWGHAWWGGPGATLAAGSVDPAQGVWWLAWAPHALGHGLNPFFTRAMFSPGGVNVLANPSYLLVSIVMAPVTVLFGPIAAFAVAATLAPAADALLAFVAMRRFTTWAPAALVGGLLYGFGPAVATELRYGHLHVTAALFPPLALIMVGRLVRGVPEHRGRTAAALAALVVGQFFVSAELLALSMVVGVVGAAAALIATRRRRHGGGVGIVIAGAAVVSAAALAYPVWWYVRGPRHFSGSVWGDPTGFSASLESFVVPHGQLRGAGFLTGGNIDYLGVPLLVVLVGGAILWRRDGMLRLSMALAAVSALLSLGPHLHVGRADTGVPLPAWPLAHVPLLSSIAPARFAVCTDLLCALGLARVLDHLRAGLRHGSGALATIAPGALGVAVLLSPALAMPWPYATVPVAEPAVLARIAAMGPGTVVREYPLPAGAHAEGVVWQAADDIPYAWTDGYAIVPGRHGRATVDPITGPLGEVFVGVSLGRQHPPFSAALVDGVRLNAWGQGATVIAVVGGARHAGVAAELLRAALGPPQFHDRSGSLWTRPQPAPARSR